MTEWCAFALGRSRPVSADCGRQLSTSRGIFREVAVSSKICFFIERLSQVHSGTHSMGPGLLQLYSSFIPRRAVHKQYKNSLSSSDEPFQSCCASTESNGKGWREDVFVYSTFIYLPVLVFFLTSLGKEKGEKVARSQKSCYEQQPAKMGGSQSWGSRSSQPVETPKSSLLFTHETRVPLRKKRAQKNTLQSTNSMEKTMVLTAFSKRKPNDDGCISSMSEHLCSS